MNIFSLGNAKRLNHNNNLSPMKDDPLKNIPKIVIQEANNANSNHGSFPDQADRRKSEPVLKKKDAKSKGHSGSWMNLNWPERFRRGSDKKPEIEREGHVLVYCTFKKPTFCDLCSKIITDLHRQGYRCKKCKKTLHESCSKQIDHCQGSPIGSFGFSPQHSTNDDFSCLSSEDQIDSVYQVLKEGINLRARKDYLDKPCSSGSESGSRKSLQHQLSEPLPSFSSPLSSIQDVRGNVSSLESLKISGTPPENSAPQSPKSSVQDRKYSRIPLLKPGDESSFDLASDGETSPAVKRKSKSRQKSPSDFDNLYVALYKYDAQQKDDLSVRAGDVVKITDSKDETWWTGELNNKSGFLPANYVMKLRQDEEVSICARVTLLKSIHNKESQLKRNQVVAIKLDFLVEDPNYVFVRTPSGEGYVRKEDLAPL